MGKRERTDSTAWPAWVGAISIVVLVFLAYRPAAGGGFVWDDDEYVTGNTALRSWQGLADIWARPSRSPQYYPVTFTSFWVEHQIWGDDARGYHETNVLLHAGACVLLWRLLRRLNVPGAYVATMVFAVHPVMAESVAWITERKNTLSMVFALGTIIAFLRFEETRRRGWYAAALGLFVLALLAKSVVGVLPVAIALLLWWKGRLDRRVVAWLMPLFVIAAIAGVNTAYLERTHVGAAGAEWQYTLAERLAIAGRAVWFYVGKLIWPANLAFVYPKWRVTEWGWMGIAGVGVTSAALWRAGRGALVGFLLFVIILAPALGLVNIYPMRYTLAADHYAYHAAAALIAMIVAAGTVLLRSVRRPWVRPAVCIALVAVLFVLTVRRSGVFHDSRTLWTDTLAKNPDGWVVWVNLGHVAASERPADWAEAGRAYRRAVELAPNIADPHYNLGLVLLEQRDWPAAEREFRRAVEIEPHYAAAWDMLGYTLAALGRVDDGIAAYRAALAINPRHAGAHFNLGVALRDRGDTGAAQREFEAAAEADPTFAAAWREVANARIRAEDFAGAAEALKTYLALRPADEAARHDLGVAMRRAGQDPGRR